MIAFPYGLLYIQFLDLTLDTSFGKVVKICVVQAGSIIYDTPKTLDKLERLTVDAASTGAELVLFPGFN